MYASVIVSYMHMYICAVEGINKHLFLMSVTIETVLSLHDHLI
jgi:hypothetical protein